LAKPIHDVLGGIHVSDILWRAEAFDQRPTDRLNGGGVLCSCSLANLKRDCEIDSQVYIF
jgi:hypothetical protein